MTVLTLLVLGMPALAFAHVSIRPRESKRGTEETYTVRVPTEGAVATTHVRLEIPDDVRVLEVMPPEGATFETAKQGDRITAITWKREIAPKASAEFVFRARNPASGAIVWKAHQHFSDGTSADWVGVAGEKRPASVTKLTAAAGAGAAQAADAGGADIQFIRVNDRVAFGLGVVQLVSLAGIGVSVSMGMLLMSRPARRAAHFERALS